MVPKNTAIDGMRSVLDMHEPSTFPMAIEAIPFRMAAILTVNSGSVVPNESNVTAIIELGMFNAFAMLLRELTVKSEPK